jgi:hypothetical protein
MLATKLQNAPSNTSSLVTSCLSGKYLLGINLHLIHQMGLDISHQFG